MSSLDVCGYQQKKYTLYNIYNMKKFFIFAASAALLASCANDEIIDNGGKQDQQVPITLSTYKKNVTRASNTLQDNEHYNFGTWAYKLTPSSKAASLVMENYLVGYAGDKIGYAHGALQTTWADAVGSLEDHTSPWVYEGLGKSEYTKASNETGENYYLLSDTRYMSAHANQYLRYWDLAYANTNFYCYAPYMASGVDLTVNADGSAEMTFDSKTSMKDGYDEPLNSSYIGSKVDRSLSEFMYGGAQATNADLKDVNIAFNHMGAQLFIRFYEIIPGYKVELINLTDESTSANSIDRFQGVQATPSHKKADDTYELAKYFVTAGGKITYSTAAVPTFTASQSGADRSDKNLMFKIPTTTATYPTGIMPSGFAANLTTYETQYNVIPEEASSAADQTYSWSPTVYYPVVQDPSQQVGFTFHVSFRIIAEDNQEVVYVHNATVHVPYNNTTWAAGTRYIYTFKITRNASGTTNPATTIDPTDPTPNPEKSLYPIVFDGCTIEDYTPADSEHLIN